MGFPGPQTKQRLARLSKDMARLELADPAGMIAQVHDLTLIRSRLSEHRAEEFASEPDMREAAVAVILRETSSRPAEILFIKRAEKPGDPWSGHMAFPGGHRDPEDEGRRAAVGRLEELRERLAPGGSLEEIFFAVTGDAPE